MQMNERAESRAPAQAAAEAVKAYIRMNRTRLAADGELLALLLPERFAVGEVRDLQRFVIERLVNENAALRAERDGLRGARAQAVCLSEGVRRAMLDLIDARTFEEAIAVATFSAEAFGLDRAALCVEGEDGSSPTGTKGVRLIAPGTIAAVLGQESMGAILSGGGEALLGPGGGECRSLAAFRLKVGRDTPAVLYVLGARGAGRFECQDLQADLAFFARALERAIRAWLDLPKI
jgi:uncharacterized protein YigA (DUF484 family)